MVVQEFGRWMNLRVRGVLDGRVKMGVLWNEPIERGFGHLSSGVAAGSKGDASRKQVAMRRDIRERRHGTFIGMTEVLNRSCRVCGVW